MAEFSVRKVVTHVYQGYVNASSEDEAIKIVEDGNVTLVDTTDYKSDYESIEVEEQ